MRNSSRRLETRTGNREFPAAVPCPQSRVTPVPAWPVASSEFSEEEAPTRIDLPYAYREQDSWKAPPRYSVVRRISVSAPPEGALRAFPARWAARLLVASVSFATIALLAFTLLSRTDSAVLGLDAGLIPNIQAAIARGRSAFAP